MLSRLSPSSPRISPRLPNGQTIVPSIQFCRMRSARSKVVRPASAIRSLSLPRSLPGSSLRLSLSEFPTSGNSNFQLLFHPMLISLLSHHDQDDFTIAPFLILSTLASSLVLLVGGFPFHVAIYSPPRYPRTPSTPSSPVTVTRWISYLSALNEAWQEYPFPTWELIRVPLALLSKPKELSFRTEPYPGQPGPAQLAHPQPQPSAVSLSRRHSIPHNAENPTPGFQLLLIPFHESPCASRARRISSMIPLHV